MKLVIIKEKDDKELYTEMHRAIFQKYQRAKLKRNVQDDQKSMEPKQ